MELIENQIINGRYRLVRELGRGGFAEVWLAEDQTLDNRPLALKFYAPERGLEQSGIELFKKEYLRATELRHPALLTPNHFDVVAQGQIPFLVMNYCPGGSLAGKVAQGYEFPEQELAAIVNDVSGGLAYLHQQGVIHRDIKPDNILIAENGKYVISDFGISLRLRTTLTKATRHGTASSGTAAFMAPELFSDQPSGSEKSDIFGFGITLFELCTGMVPWQSMGGLALLQGAAMPPLPERFSRRFERLIHKCMSVDPRERPSAPDLQRDAATFLSDGSWPDPTGKKEAAPTARLQETGRRTVEMSGRAPAATKQQPPPSAPKAPVRQKIKIPGGLYVIVGIGIVLVGALIFVAAGGLKKFGSRTGSDSTALADTVAADTTNVIAADSTAAPNTDTVSVAKPEVQPAVAAEKPKAPTQQPSTQTTTSRYDQALADGMAAYNADDYTKAFPKLKLAAENGKTDAYFYVGYMYEEGLGCTQSYSDAIRYYKLAAALGSSAAQNNMGYLYEYGYGVNQDYAQAASWYRKAADNGNAIAQNNLGNLYENGQGLGKDLNEALKWYQKSADQGNSDAKDNVKRVQGLLSGPAAVQYVKEEFSSMSSRFNDGSDADKSWRTENGYFAGRAYNDQYIFSKRYGFDFLSGASWFDLSLDVKKVSGSDEVSAGISFAGTNADATYRFGISNDGYYYIGDDRTGEWKGDWKQSSLVNIGSWNTLRVIYNGSNFIYYLNNMEVARKSAYVAGNYVGMYFDGSITEARFDNLIVRSGSGR